MKLFESQVWQQLKTLGLPLDDFAVFGSGPMWLRDIRESSDLDLVARGEAWSKALEIGELDTERGAIHFPGTEIEMFRTWAPGEWNVDKLIDEAEVVDDVRFVTLENVAKWKTLKGREKDVTDLILIQEYNGQK
jgi:hypothetical protein